MKTPPPYRFAFDVYPPVQRVRPGDSLRVKLPDCDGLDAQLKRMDRRWFDWPKRTAFPGNPVYGPIYVEGAQPGDALGVELEAIRPDRRLARTLIAPHHGFLPDALFKGLGVSRSPGYIPRRLVWWKLGRNTARMVNPFQPHRWRIPLAPFLGCIATASRSGIATLRAGPQGGNLDLNDLRAGVTIWLPVTVPGGLLFVGDMHAAQGHGEVVGGGLEVSGEVQLRCHLRKRAGLRGPRYRTKNGRGCVRTHLDLERALQAAVTAMIQWFCEDGLDRFDAYLLISQIGEFHLGGISADQRTVACFCPRLTAKANP